jgi:hypothetical protein
MKKKVLERHLREHSCVPMRKKGKKHEVWVNTVTLAQTVVPRHTEINTFTARGICEQLGVPIPKGR